MKFLTITKSKPIKLSVDTALKAGTPISITGEIANDDTAIGLVANDTAAGTESIAIVTEGMVDVNEIAASYGEALTDDCIAALKGITFLHGGKAVVPAGGGGGGLPDYSEASDGDVLSIEDGAPAWKEPSGGGEFTAIFTQTITPGNPPTFSVTCDKTFAEITAANEAGEPINMLLTNGATTTRLLYNITASSIVVMLLQIVEAQNLLTLGVYTMAEDNTITMHTYGCEVTQMM